MTSEADLRRQVSYLRVALAYARETAANHYKAIAAVTFGAVAFAWLWLTVTLEGDAEASAKTLCAGAGFLVAIGWLTAHNHHRQRRRDLAEAMDRSRADGYSVEIRESGLDFGERRSASAHPLESEE